MAKKEFAPGIPERVTHEFPKNTSPAVFQFGLHHHFSEGPAKEHYDLRLGDPDTGHAHSWALKYLPKPGESRLAIQQPTHTLKYMDFAGRIESGYGRGRVDLARRDKAEVISSSSGHVRFNLYPGKGVEEYLLRKTDKEDPSQWLLTNITATKERVDVPSSKPSYKPIDVGQLGVDNPNTVLQAKIDGAHVLYNFKKPGSTPDIYSYRPTERDSGLIEHTHRVPGVFDQRTKGAIKDTVLRGELYAVDKDGKALPAARVGGILNAGVWKSREKQEHEGKLVPIVFDVVKWRGKDVSDAPFSEKKKLLLEAVKNAPWLKLPRTAETPEEKKQLIKDIKSGKEPSTSEGVIQWYLDKSTPAKAKFLDEQDVYARRVFMEQGKRQGLAGGFEFSKEPKGPVVGRVGTGMSHALKKDMADNPDRYVGLHAKIKVQKAPEHYAPRAPSFAGWHLDQDIPEGAKMAFKLQGRTEIQGIPVAIENQKGSVRKGVGDDGKPWRTVMRHPYGYIVGTKGKDGEEVDAYVGPKKDAPIAYVVHQHKENGKGHDEDKVMLGFESEEEARKGYLKHYDDPKFLGPISAVPMERLKDLVDSNETLKKIQ